MAWYADKIERAESRRDGGRERRWWRGPGSRRAHLAGLATLLAYGGAVAAATLTGPGLGGLTGGIESASAASATLLGRLAVALPFGYAFVAGMVAAFNPCGFALLPAYLGLYLGDEGDTGGQAGARHPGHRTLRAAWISALVTASFVALFGLVGLALSVATARLAGAFPWLGLLAGILLVLAGGLMLGGRPIYAGLGGRLAGRLGGAARRSGSLGYLAYGLAYGLGSLGCTLPIFLAVVGGALTAGGVPAATGQFVLYALGMGTVLAVLTLGVVAFKSVTVSAVRGVARYVQPVGALLLQAAGAYLIYYWLTLGGLLARAGLG